MRSVLVIFVFLIVLFVACDGDSPRPDGEEQAEIQAYLDSLGVDYSVDENGIHRYLITPNTDQSLYNSGDIFSIQYELYELGGDLIDSVTDNTQITEIVLKQGEGAVFPVGVDQALSYMDAGETMGFVIPSALAYDDLSLTGITDNVTLHAIITLVEVRDQEMVEEDEEELIDEYSANNLEDGNEPVRTLPQGLNMRIKTTRDGISGTAVITNDTVSVSYVMRTLDGQQIDAVGAADPFAFIVDGETPIILGLNEAVKEMQLNERATLVLPSRAAYFYSAAVIPGYLVDPAVIQIEDNPLFVEKVLPTYAARVRPFQVILVELELLSIN